MGIIVLLATITAVFYPKASDDNALAMGANRVQMMVVSGRQKARRDHLVTGVRLIPDVNTGNFQKLLLVQKPADLTGYSLGNLNITKPAAGVYLANFVTDVWGGDFEAMVMPWDYLVVNSTRQATYFSAYGASGKILQIGANLDDPASPIKNMLRDYRIIRQARPVPGEEPLELPIGYEIMLTPSGTPRSQLPPVIGSNYDILFDMAGGNANIGNNQDVFLWMHKIGSSDYNSDAIIAIRKRTGAVGVFSPGPATDVFLFARDPRVEGL